MTNNEMKTKLYEVFKTLNDEQVIELWNAYNQTLTCEVEECFFSNTAENREAIFSHYDLDDVLTAIFQNNYGFNLESEYFRFFPEPLIEGCSLRQARRSVNDDILEMIANNLVIEHETLGLPYIKEIIKDTRSEVEDYLTSIAPMYLAELYCDYWNKANKSKGFYFINEMSNFDDEFQYDKPYEVAQIILNSHPHFNPNHHYFKMYRNYITTSDDVFDLINFSALVDYIVNENDSLGDVELQRILNESLSK